MLSIVTFAESSGPLISPAGDSIAYAAVDVSDESNILARHPTAFLHVVKLTGKQDRRLPNEVDHADTPVWSPDGRTLAFLRTRGGQRQVMLWDAVNEGTRAIGEAFPEDRSLWSSEGLQPQWLPDGKTLILPMLEQVAPQPLPRVRVVRSTDAVVPGDHFFIDSRLWKIVALEARSGRARLLTPKSIALRGLVVSPDGRHVLYQAVRPETLGHFRAEKLDWWTVSLSGDEPPSRVFAQGREHPAPPWLACSGDGREVLWPESGKLLSRPLEGGEERVVVENFPETTRLPRLAARSQMLALLAARPHTGPKDPKMYSILRPVEDVLVTDLANRRTRTLTPADRNDEISDLTWSSDGQALFYRAVDLSSLEETIYRWSAGELKAHRAFSANEFLSGLSPSADGRLLAFTAMSATAPADGYLLDLGEERRRPVTRLNPQLNAFRFVAPEVFDYYSADGESLRALLFKPVGAGPTHPVPVVTYVYEKLSPLRNRFDAEAQMHVSHGYAYLMPDVSVHVGHTGESFVKSVVPAVNAARAQGFTNGRFGIHGGSFGGYAGLFLISHVDIFSAAVLRAPPSDFFSTWGDGRDRDIWTIETGQARTGGNPWEMPQVFFDNSPFFSADRVHTPVLIQHGEKDYTVPLEQGVMMFSALRALKRPAEMALYREGDHSIVRGSRSDFLEVYRRTLNWWDRYLRGSLVPEKTNSQ